MSVLNKVVLATLPYVPRPIMRRMAARYIAGETLDDALDRLKLLRDRGHPGIIDVLGEGIASEAQARTVAATYREAASAVAASHLDTYVSVKPTHVGLTIGEDLCFELYSSIASHARDINLRMRVEMEDSPTTDGTLRVFERLRARFDNVGIVLQARLFRTPRDIDELTSRTTKSPLDVRIVKGIYLEPSTIAHTEPEPIRAAYIDMVRKLAQHNARLSLATHDEIMAAKCFTILRDLGRSPDTYEMQVLMGVREELWTLWKNEGHTVRVYVPYGPEWRAYSQRRMRKNPHILKHVMRQFVGLK